MGVAWTNGNGPWIRAEVGILQKEDIVAWAWMLWLSDVLEHGRYCGLGMDALVVGSSGTWTILWQLVMGALVIGCSGK